MSKCIFCDKHKQSHYLIKNKFCYIFHHNSEDHSYIVAKYDKYILSYDEKAKTYEIIDHTFNKIIIKIKQGRRPILSSELDLKLEIDRLLRLLILQ